jgi:hypothetical protein
MRGEELYRELKDWICRAEDPGDNVKLGSHTGMRKIRKNGSKDEGWKLPKEMAT